MSNLDFVDELQQRLSILVQAGQELHAAVELLLRNPVDVSPWTSWLLLGLVRHRERQQFVLDCIKYRLDGSAGAIAARGALAHLDRPGRGIVPGGIDWEYRFHGRGCCLTHRASGERIDVDFFDETADWISLYFYSDYLQSLRKPAVIEGRIRELFPTSETVSLDMRDLVNRGVLEKQESYTAFRLAFRYVPMNELLVDLENSWDPPTVRRALAAAISDELIRHAIRSPIPINRIQIAAALAVIDQPWSRNELTSVLLESTDQEMTSECRSALLESRCTAAHENVQQWEVANPYVLSDERNLMFADLAKQRHDEYLRYEMQRLHDRVFPLRDGFEPQG